MKKKMLFRQFCDNGFYDITIRMTKIYFTVLSVNIYYIICILYTFTKSTLPTADMLELGFQCYSCFTTYTIGRDLTEADMLELQEPADMLELAAVLSYARELEARGKEVLRGNTHTAVPCVHVVMCCRSLSYQYTPC